MPGATLALFGRGPGQDRDQAVHAGHGVVLLPPGQAAVHHHLDPLDGQTGFGDVRGERDLAPQGRIARSCSSKGDLRTGDEIMELLPFLSGRFSEIRRKRGFPRRPRQKDQKVAGGLTQYFQEGGGDPLRKEPFSVGGEIALFD